MFNLRNELRIGQYALPFSSSSSSASIAKTDLSNLLILPSSSIASLHHFNIYHLPKIPKYLSQFSSSTWDIAGSDTLSFGLDLLPLLGLLVVELPLNWLEFIAVEVAEGITTGIFLVLNLSGGRFIWTIENSI